MRFAFTQEQLLFQSAVRDMLQQRCSPTKLRAAWDHDDAVAAELWQQQSHMGVAAMTLPES